MIPLQNKLWTRDFTIITVGSVISMLGSSLSGFAMSLLVLDYTGDPFLFALYNVFYMVPDIVVPIFIGPFLDRFSRRRTIYVLDFITAGVYVVFAVIINAGWFNFPILAVGCLLIGTIGSIYMVAYDSFYPLLVTEGNFQKAYSIASTLETLAVVTVPLSVLIYDKIGIFPLFMIDAASYLIAAIMETQIKTNEKYIEKQKQNDDGKRGFRRFASDFSEGLRYITVERGLLAVTLYFTFSSILGGAYSALALPYLTDAFPEYGKYIAVLTWGVSALGRTIFGFFHYKKKIPKHRKYAIAFAVYITISIIDGVFLYLPIIFMAILCFTEGCLGVTSYTIRISATQRYVPDERKGRFNGAFSTMMALGTIGGELAAGALAKKYDMRIILAVFAGITVIAAIVFIGGGRKPVSAIYNTED